MGEGGADEKNPWPLKPGGERVAHRSGARLSGGARSSHRELLPIRTVLFGLLHRGAEDARRAQGVLADASSAFALPSIWSIGVRSRAAEKAIGFL